MTLLVFLLCLSSAASQSSLGYRCTHNLQCGTGAFCNENVCRKDFCATTNQCRTGEVCEYGVIDGVPRVACFAAKVNKKTTEEFCPGGGAVVMGADGKLSTCDLNKSCGTGHVCNPHNGICCTKIRTCPKPSKVITDIKTGHPLMCQFKAEMPQKCPGGCYCEQKTGFCCQTGDTGINPLPKTKPVVREKCTVREGCDGGAVCNCGNTGICSCECPIEIGFSVSKDGKSCQRQRRRLKEKCKNDMECSAAFSECATGGCRCKQGFQRDGNGGCKPITYKCPGGISPLMKKEKPIVCHKKSPFRSYKNITSSVAVENTTSSDLPMQNDFMDREGICPQDYYCVTFFDDASKPGYTQGFCCPDPSNIRPTCPVGKPHESSSYPSFGCAGCPSEYYCHRDGVSTDKTICCPKPCTSLDDIYHEGQCYSTAFYGDSCFIDAQCTPMRTKVSIDSESSHLECRKGICSCPTGYSHINGQCQRITCTVGFRGEPSVDRNNEFYKCSRSNDCSQGQLCDITHGVCCKGTNRCPSGLEETGEMCSSGSCSQPSHLCHKVNDFKKTNVCCQSS